MIKNAKQLKKYCICSIIIILTGLVSMIIYLAINGVENDGVVNICNYFCTLLSIGLASIALLSTIASPEFKIIFKDQHGNLLHLEDDKYIPIGIFSDNTIGYLPYSPTNWEMYIRNTGNIAAENLKINICIKGVYFKNDSYIYGVENFMYGCGVFQNVCFELNETLRRDETFRLPKIPLYFSENDNKKNDISTMYITIQADNMQITKKEFKVKFVPDDQGKFTGIDEVIYDNELENVIEELLDNRQNNTRIDPYKCNLDKSKLDAYRKIYKSYFDCNISSYVADPKTQRCVQQKLKAALKDKALFWGRIYYASCGYSMEQCENMLTNDFMNY